MREKTRNAQDYAKDARFEQEIQEIQDFIYILWSIPRNLTN
jgi:hypothetical protein